MSSSRIDVFVHFVWQTKKRQRTLTGELELFVHQHIRNEAEKLGLHTLAVNSAWDHIHCLFGWNSQTTLSKAAKQFKGASSYLWNNQERDPEEHQKLEWQAGFGSFSIRPNEIADVQRYIDRQKEHHSEGKMWWRFERPFWREREFDDAFLPGDAPGQSTESCDTGDGQRCITAVGTNHPRWS